MKYALWGIAAFLIVSAVLMWNRGVPATPGEMIPVPAGTFEMGDPTNETGRGSLPVHEVTLSAYEIGKFEVANREYATVLNWALANVRLETASPVTVAAFGRQLVDLSPQTVVSQQCQISYSDSGFDVKMREGLSMADYPVIQVSWFGAAAYCNWLSDIEGLQPCFDTNTWICDFSKNGFRLPTEAEWERAAAWDGSRHLRYGNGSNEIDGKSANYSLMAANRRIQRVYLGPDEYANGGALPVGYFNGRRGTRDSPSPIGAYDMSGNVAEWCYDWWSYVSQAPAIDPTGPDTGESRVVRGGGASGDKDAERATTTTRPADEPADCFSHGFRVARSIRAR